MKKEKKVYVVTSGCYPDYEINAVFDNKKDAELYCSKYDDCTIEEYVMNEPVPERLSYKVYFDRNKNITGIYVNYPSEDVESISFMSDRMILFINANDMDHARKKASDELMMVLANQLTHFPLLYTKCVEKQSYSSTWYDYPVYDIRTFEIILSIDEKVSDMFKAPTRTNYLFDAPARQG